MGLLFAFGMIIAAFLLCSRMFTPNRIIPEEFVVQVTPSLKYLNGVITQAESTLEHNQLMLTIADHLVQDHDPQRQKLCDKVAAINRLLERAKAHDDTLSRHRENVLKSWQAAKVDGTESTVLQTGD